MDLTTTYMGLTLRHPVVPSASPLSRTVASIERLAEAGAAAVVLHSLFEEQMKAEGEALDHFLSRGTYRFAESLTYYPDLGSFNLAPDQYLEHIRKAKAAVDIPIIASLNGVSAEGWTDYAAEIEQAGADGLELNVYFIPTDVDLTGPAVEDRYESVLKAVKSKVRIPVAMKLGPYFSATANMAARLDRAGADALVLFNRFYQPIIDVEQLEVRRDLMLSQPFESRLPLRWIAILYGRLKASLAITTGIHTPEGVVQAVMAGADVTQVCSVLLKDGPRRIADLVQGARQWLEARGYESLAQVKGILSQEKCPQPAVFERANYVRTIGVYTYPGEERAL
jgi:dihydroorotate dehydrogenase (fumarate)